MHETAVCKLVTSSSTSFTFFLYKNLSANTLVQSSNTSNYIYIYTPLLCISCIFLQSITPGEKEKTFVIAFVVTRPNFFNRPSVGGITALKCRKFLLVGFPYSSFQGQFVSPSQDHQLQSGSLRSVMF